MTWRPATVRRSAGAEGQGAYSTTAAAVARLRLDTPARMGMRTRGRPRASSAAVSPPRSVPTQQYRVGRQCRRQGRRRRGPARPAGGPSRAGRRPARRRAARTAAPRRPARRSGATGRRRRRRSRRAAPAAAATRTTAPRLPRWRGPRARRAGPATGGAGHRVDGRVAGRRRAPARAVRGRPTRPSSVTASTSTTSAGRRRRARARRAAGQAGRSGVTTTSTSAPNRTACLSACTPSNLHPGRVTSGRTHHARRRTLDPCHYSSSLAFVVVPLARTRRDPPGGPGHRDVADGCAAGRSTASSAPGCSSARAVVPGASSAPRSTRCAGPATRSPRARSSSSVARCC